MGSKYGGTKGLGMGRSSLTSTSRLNVSLRVAEAKALLECLTSGIIPPKEVAKAVALAVVRAINTGGSGDKGKGKYGMPKGQGKTGTLGTSPGTVRSAARR
jgi:hypothetical protein